MSACSIDGCSAPVVARGWCRKHYGRWHKHGSTSANLSPSRGKPMRFIEAALAADTADCILWPFAKYANGYGIVFHEGKITGAHRVVCKLYSGDPPASKPQAAHDCGERACINPKHIRWATQSENEQDKIPHGRHQRGERNGAAKLTNAQALEIFRRNGSCSQQNIAREYGVSRRTVRNIQNGNGWRTVTANGDQP